MEVFVRNFFSLRLELVNAVQYVKTLDTLLHEIQSQRLSHHLISDQTVQLSHKRKHVVCRRRIQELHELVAAVQATDAITFVYLVDGFNNLKCHVIPRCFLQLVQIKQHEKPSGVDELAIRLLQLRTVELNHLDKLNHLVLEICRTNHGNSSIKSLQCFNINLHLVVNHSVLCLLN